VLAKSLHIQFVRDTSVELCASRATWLGNDETHYIKKWPDKDLSDLKKLIDIRREPMERQPHSPDTGKFVPNVNVALAVDPANHPLVAYWVQTEDSQNYDVLIWNPDSGQVTSAVDSNNPMPNGTNLWLIARTGKNAQLQQPSKD
jgi:hypothetical protein